MKRRMIHLFAMTASLFALTFGLVNVASAGPATDLVKTKQTALFELLKRGGPESEKKVSALFDEMLDYGSLAETSLGSEWAARSDVEKSQFTDLLKQLVRKSYERNLKKTLNFNIEYIGEAPSNGAITVKTKAVSRTDARDEPVEIVYKLSERGGTFRVQDIVTEGVSLVTSYRAQFTKIVKKDGFPALVQKMKDKLAKGDA